MKLIIDWLQTRNYKILDIQEYQHCIFICIKTNGKIELDEYEQQDLDQLLIDHDLSNFEYSAPNCIYLYMYFHKYN